MTPPETVEHGSTRSERWLHDKRLNIAAWVALVEGLLIVVGVIPRMIGLILGAVLIVLYFANYYRDSAARARRSGLGHSAAWIVAASQALVILVALALIILKAVAIVAVGVIAVLALVVLLSDRRRT